MADKTVSVPPEELTALVEQITEGGGAAEMESRGYSMRPMLQFEGSKVRLTAPGKLRRGDVALYRYPNGKCVLHRIVAVRKDGTLVCRGDNNVRTERCVSPAWVVAVATDFTYRGKWVSCGAKGYRLYWKTWLLLWPLRRLALPVYHRLFAEKKKA